ncbi:MAG: phosphate ABC transporter ATP-binding protein [Pirellulaceae bacterium]|nr:phosphate ABC transporter ATP-binding protein [Pirellulaceae bacterium]
MVSHIRFENVTVRYGRKTALDDVWFEIPKKRIFAVIGPANSGKTTMLKCINRTIDFIPNATVEGLVSLDGDDVFRMRNVYQLRRRVGMVFPLPVGLPLSVYENVAYAPRRAGINNRSELDEIVETSLRQAMLWDEVKDRLQMLGTMLSGGQQQRLTLARALSLRPEILCLDEFSIAIDPVTTMRIEDILRELQKEMTIVLVTNLVQQARRLAGQTAFFSASKLIEVGETERIFTAAANKLTERYVRGDFG